MLARAVLRRMVAMAFVLGLVAMPAGHASAATHALEVRQEDSSGTMVDLSRVPVGRRGPPPSAPG